MSETQLRKTPLPEFEAEQEVDFGRYGRALAARWWLVVAGLAAGVIIGLLVSLGGTTFYRAQAVVYLGQPLAPGGGGQVSSSPTQLALVDQIVRAESTIRRVAAKAGLRPGQLRGHVATRPITGLNNTRLGATAPLSSITVTGSAPKKIAVAADEFARIVVNAVSGYVNVKVEQLQEHLVFDERELKGVSTRLTSVLEQQRRVLADKSLDTATQLIAVSNFNAQLSFLESRRANLEQDRFAVRQLLKLATDVEQGRVAASAAAQETSARSRRNSVLIGGLIGLILGALAAILWEPVTRRFVSRPAA